MVEQDARLAKRATDLTALDLVIVRETQVQGPLHKAYSVNALFQAVLIGKDGLEKWRTTKPFLVQDVIDLIDRMPMRQDEKRQKQTP